jgi:hypothetical protein
MGRRGGKALRGMREGLSVPDNHWGSREEGQSCWGTGERRESFLGFWDPWGQSKPFCWWTCSLFSRDGNCKLAILVFQEGQDVETEVWSGKRTSLFPFPERILSSRSVQVLLRLCNVS